MQNTNHGFTTNKRIVTDKILLELTQKEVDEMMHKQRKDYLVFKLKKLKLLIDMDVYSDTTREAYEQTMQRNERIDYRRKAMDWTLAELEDI